MSVKVAPFGKVTLTEPAVTDPTAVLPVTGTTVTGDGATAGGAGTTTVIEVVPDDVLKLGSLNVAVIVWVPATWDAYVTEQLSTFIDNEAGISQVVGEKVPSELLVKLTVPAVGKSSEELTDTVAVHVVVCALVIDEGEHATVVEDGSAATAESFPGTSWIAPITAVIPITAKAIRNQWDGLRWRNLMSVTKGKRYIRRSLVASLLLPCSSKFDTDMPKVALLLHRIYHYVIVEDALGAAI